MDLTFSAEQRALADSVTALCRRLAGPKRAIELDRDGAYDQRLHAALFDAGFFQVAQEMGLLEATLVAELLARHAAVVSFAASGLVLAGLGRDASSEVVAVQAEPTSPLRYAQHATRLLCVDGTEARMGVLEAGAALPLPSSFMFPLGKVTLPPQAEALGEGSGARARDLLRLALAAECVGTMDGALELTVQYVSQRRQFGRAIGSFQAVQHRLAQAKVWLEGARYLTYEAAAKGADTERVALAAAHATQAARLIHTETHQLTGALGFTREHDLFVWSMRLQALRVELGGTTAHRRAVAQARWGLGP